MNLRLDPPVRVRIIDPDFRRLVVIIVCRLDLLLYQKNEGMLAVSHSNFKERVLLGAESVDPGSVAVCVRFPSCQTRQKRQSEPRLF